MTHLRIIQNNGVTEEVSSSVILKLYELVSSGDLDASSNLKGRLHTGITYLDYITYLLGQFPGTNDKGPLYISATDIALRFTDPEVLRVLVANGVGSNGLISSSDAASLTDIYTVSGAVNWFLENTTITTLNDLNNFPNLHIIRSAAFKDCTSLTNVNLSNITTINANAFLNDTALLTVNLSGLTTMSGTLLFKGCTALTSANIGSVTAISNSAFKGCTNLTTIDLSNVTSIGSEAFNVCTSLTSVDLSSVTSIGGWAFSQCSSLTSIGILNSVTSIGEGAFSQCSSLTSCTIGNDVTSINRNVFYQCTSLTSCTIGNNVTSIGNYAFESCLALTSINLSNVTSIGTSAFGGCTALTSIDLSSATSIGSNCFIGCTSLSSITVPNHTFSFGTNLYIFRNTAISNIDLSNITVLGKGWFYDCANLTLITLPSLIAIPEEFFCNCSNLTLILGLTSGNPISPSLINNYAFKGCSRLPITSYIDFSDCTSIGHEALRECLITGVINLPECLSLGLNPFYSCTAITELHAPKLITINNNSDFNNMSGVRIFDAPNATFCPAFNGNTVLETINTKATKIGSLLGCTALTTLNIDFDNIQSLPNWGLTNCIALTGTLDFAVLRSIGALCLSGCHFDIVLRKSDEICTHVNWGNNFSGFTGTVYVPDALLSTYRADTNWSKLPSSQMKGISELPSS